MGLRAARNTESAVWLKEDCEVCVSLWTMWHSASAAAS